LDLLSLKEDIRSLNADIANRRSSQMPLTEYKRHLEELELDIKRARNTQTEFQMEEKRLGKVCAEEQVTSTSYSR
jgi:hypothetical protein